MKDSKKYSEQVKKLYRSLKKTYGAVEDKTYEEPLDAIIYGVLSEKLTTKDTRLALSKIDEYFVDINELRVSRPDEISEVTGIEREAILEVFDSLAIILCEVFDIYGSLSLIELTKEGKRPARQALEKIKKMSRFAVDYCMLTSLDAHAIPITERMSEYLKYKGAVDEDSDIDDIEGFLNRIIPSKNGYEFYSLLREASEKEKIKRPRKESKSRKKKVSPKSAKKKVKKAVTKKKTKSKVVKKAVTKTSTASKNSKNTKSASKKINTKKTAKKKTAKKKTSKK